MWGGTDFTEFTATHEFGHVFFDQTANATPFMTQAPQGLCPEGLKGCMSDPNLAVNDGNAANALRGPDSRTQFVFGTIRRIYILEDVQVRIDLFDPNGSYGVNADNQAQFTYNVCSDGTEVTSGSSCPDKRPPNQTRITDWERGTSGWDIVIDPLGGSNNFGACADPGEGGYTVSDFQQNPCVVYEWILNLSGNNDGVLELVEKEEAAADMFLNWVYKETDSNPNAFGDNEDEATGRYQEASGHGDDRFFWMQENLAPLFQYYGW